MGLVLICWVPLRILSLVDFLGLPPADGFLEMGAKAEISLQDSRSQEKKPGWNKQYGDERGKQQQGLNWKQVSAGITSNAYSA